MSHTLSSRSTEPTERVSLFAYSLLALIFLYRLTLSPFIGSSCRFYPTCSHYAENALRKYGALKGSLMAIKRLAKCGPWHAGGYDPVE